MTNPKRFDVYGKGAGRWQRIASFDGRDRAAALTAAETHDAGGAFDGVRVLAVHEVAAGRAPIETEEWSSPRLAQRPPPATAAGTVTADDRRRILRFLETVLRRTAASVPRLDARAGFGVQLFVAGAAQGLGARKGLTEMQRFVLVRECLEGIGTAPAQVDRFCGRLFEHRADGRYRAMIDAGEQAIARHLAGDEARSLRLFAEALKNWLEETRGRAAETDEVAILVTDLVGSTGLTVDDGDGVQSVVGAHDALVRAALAEFRGIEIRHTGDGILARFRSTPAAVGAAIAIQRLLARNNRDRGDLPVHVRIGLNAGVSVDAENDYLGPTVQLSARVCGQADAGEIYVTGRVRELCRGHALRFADAGRFELKGLPTPVPLYAVGWRAAGTPPPGADGP